MDITKERSRGTISLSCFAFIYFVQSFILIFFLPIQYAVKGWQYCKTGCLHFLNLCCEPDALANKFIVSIAF